MLTEPNSRSRTLSKLSRLVPLLSLCALTSISTGAAPAEVTLFTGGDPGEGLDMQGNFTYAVNVGPSGAAGRVGDANFTADNISGVTVVAGNNIGNGGWLAATYGETQNDNNLEFVMNSIRWSAAAGAPPEVTIRLRVETGIEYKLQLLFGEDCCIGRGFNVIINGNTEAVNLMPGVLQTGEGEFATQKEIVGVVLTQTFTSPGNELVIVLDGNAADAAEINDRNAIINGLTLERISAVTDADGDGLRDDWEVGFFGNLAQTGTADFDSDGLTNRDELDKGTDPTKADSDGDTLSDSAEVNTHHTDPAKADTDGDALADGAELNRYQTDPTKPDTDSDTFSDFNELRLLTDPKSAQSKPTRTTVGTFSGADAGEGLDLQGNFIYAIDAGPEGAAGGQAGDALFVGEGTDPNATIIAANRNANWNVGINYGDTPAELVLADVMHSITWSDWNRPMSDVSINLSNLVVGASYKLQLLFAEQAWPRGFDVSVNGIQIADDFAPVFYQGRGFPLSYPDTNGVVLTHTFVAPSNNVTVLLDGKGTTIPEFSDHNAIINALTLEQTGAPADSDGDSLPDAWETEVFGNLNQTGAQDTDSDTISNSTEFGLGLNPASADTDNDGLSDSQERTRGTKPGNADSDFDGLADGAEANTHQTDPLKLDSDLDGMSDGAEIAAGRNPTVSETRAIVQGFRGGDPGEGLDLDGNFIYAFSVIPDSSGVGQVRDANFTVENVEGVTIGRGPSQAPNWFVPEFGDTPNDDALEQVVQNIRHGGNGIDVTLSNLVVGALYKVQLIFGEQCCARGLDISVNGKQIVDEFAPFVVQQGINNQAIGAVVAYEFVASSSNALIQTFGNTVTTPRYGDRNPIINAVTLEQVIGNVDSDGDTLSDAWETFYFGNLGSNGSGDPDNDGLNNAGELQFGTDPTVADADADGLNDNAEKTAGTNPNLADTDGDSLNDGAEVNTHRTNPVSADIDRDGRPDPAEIAAGSNPSVADTGTIVGAFSGGDAGEGLDLDGTFVYAFSILPDTTAVGQVRDAVFTSENVDGVTVSQAVSQIPNWFVPEFGSTPNDDALEQIVQNIRHGGGGATIVLSNLTVGRAYKLQLLFGEGCCARGMDIRLNGVTIADEFAPYEIQGGIADRAHGAVVAHEFVASTNRVVIQTVGSTVTTARYTDRNPIINAVTLENVGAAPATLRITAFTRGANGFTATFSAVSGSTYVLEYKERLADATWQQAGTVTATGATATITDDNAAHRTPATGFWRIRGQ